MQSPAISSAASLFAEGCAWLEARSIERALQLLNEAQAAGANQAECAAARWQCWMLLGEDERAWREGDCIDNLGVPDPHRLWDGRPLDGRRVMLRCLHGLGDALQFARYIPMLGKIASRLTVETPPKLAPLFGQQPGWGEIVTWGKDAPAVPAAWDAQVEIMELPRIFRIAPAELPVQPPYLRVERCAAVSAMFAEHRVSPRIGLCWASSEWDTRRSMSLATLQPLLNVLPSTLYSVQWGAERGEIPAVSLRRHIIDTAAEFGDISAMAAVLNQLDLVITVDGMVAHLAGALGRRVRLMLPYAADWRWGLEARTTAWYPKMTLFRQRSPGEWGDLVESIAKEFLHEYR